MSESLLESAYKERESLMEELKKIKTYQKLMMIEGVIAAYGGSLGKSTGSTNSTRTKSMKDSVDDLAIECIEGNGGQATKAQIAEYLATHNIEMSKPNLAAYLSASERVTYDSEAKAWVVS